MQFLYQPLTWGFVLVGVPVLIHLINMLRHRRIRWAAMSFLMESHRRNRRWVLLKQWLLLASRMLAMFLLVMMLAKWVSAAQWLSWFGGQTTHHYILLDDSYSMATVEGKQTAYARALGAISGLVKSISARPGQNQITLVRWSRATLALREAGSDARLDVAADLLGQSITQRPEALLEQINATEPTSLALAPEQALELVLPLISENAEQQSEIYLLSDFRRNEFAEPDALRNQLQAAAQNKAGIHLIDCVEEQEPNVSLVSLEPEKGVWSSGVPLMVRFQVRNRQERAINNVVVRLKAITYAEGAATPQVENRYSGEVLDLPAIVVEQLAPGETVTRQSQVVFGVPGHHVVEASIEEDALAFDNRRWCAIEIKQSQQILVIDGSIQQTNAFYLENVFNPNPRLATGLSIEKEDAAFLRDVAPERLADFDVIALLDVPRMDPQAIEKLKEFCDSGGGVFFVLGENTNLNFANESLVTAGLLPFELESIEELESQSARGAAQVQATDHNVLGPLLQLEASPFGLLQIRKTFRVGDSEQSSMEVVATGPGDRPLLVDHGVGQGRVLTLLTGFSNDWSNWVQDPTFVVMVLRSMGYLGNARKAPSSQAVGTPIEMVVAGQAVLPEAEVIVPARDDGIRVRLPREVDINQEEGEVARLSLSIDLAGADRNLTDSLLRPGAYEAWMTGAQGERLVRTFAHNVPAAEGDLETVSPSELEGKLSGVDLQIQTADAVSSLDATSQDFVQSTLLMFLLALLLLGEQALAYSASYHAPVLGARS